MPEYGARHVGFRRCGPRGGYLRSLETFETCRKNRRADRACIVSSADLVGLDSAEPGLPSLLSRLASAVPSSLQLRRRLCLRCMLGMGATPRLWRMGAVGGWWLPWTRMGRMGLRTLSSLGLAMGLLRISAIDLSLPPRQRWRVTPEPIREHETLLGKFEQFEEAAASAAASPENYQRSNGE